VRQHTSRISGDDVKISKPLRYHSYLLRFWEESGQSWRFMLENPHSGERRGFGSLEALVAFLGEVSRAERETE
jgi:hypothetical protein